MKPFLKKYWWVVAIVAIALFIFSNKAGESAGTEAGQGLSNAEEAIGTGAGLGLFAIAVAIAASL